MSEYARLSLDLDKIELKLKNPFTAEVKKRAGWVSRCVKSAVSSSHSARAGRETSRACRQVDQLLTERNGTNCMDPRDKILVEGSTKMTLWRRDVRFNEHVVWFPRRLICLRWLLCFFLFEMSSFCCRDEWLISGFSSYLSWLLSQRMNSCSKCLSLHDCFLVFGGGDDEGEGWLVERQQLDDAWDNTGFSGMEEERCGKERWLVDIGVREEEKRLVWTHPSGRKPLNDSKVCAAFFPLFLCMRNST